MDFSRWLAAGALILLASTASRAEPQAECACVAAPLGQQSNVGLVTGAEGDVLISTRQGFVNAAAGQAFEANTRFMVGCEASASIRIGEGCSVDLKPGAEVSVIALDGNICVRPVGTNSACGGGSLQSSSAMHGGTPHVGLPAGIFLGTAALGFGISEAFGNGDSPASQ